MSMQICVLGSGSAGNSTLVRVGGEAILIDAGFGPRAISKRLKPAGAELDEVRAILLTHLDTDHFRPTWIRALVRRGITVYCHRRRLPRLYEIAAAVAPELSAWELQSLGLFRAFNGDAFKLPLETAAMVNAVDLAHDEAGTSGFLIDTPGGRLGYATDLGRVPDDFAGTFGGVDVLAIESNYDPRMQAASARPYFLQQRIMGGAGHLSNPEAFEAVRTVVDRSPRPPRHIVLLHLSRDCNDPRIVHETFAAHPAIAPRLCITSQHEPTPWLGAGDALPHEKTGQLRMFA